MKVNDFLKKFVFNPIKKSLIWYITKMAESGNYIFVTGTFPISYYEFKVDKKRKNVSRKKNSD